MEEREADVQVGPLRIWVLARQFDQAQDYWDGNWLVVEARVRASGADVCAEGPILHLSELQRFAEECRSLHESLGGEARLSCMEPNLDTVLRAREHGQVDAAVSITSDHMTQRHEFEFELDQSHLPAITRAIDDVLRQYPIRGTR